MKKCPFCGEEIQDEAIKCKHCKEWLNKPSDRNAVKETVSHTKLTPEQLAQERSELGTPDMRPMAFDRTFEAWLLRIGLWGRTKIVHNDPEFRTRREVTQEQFIDRVADSDLLTMMGTFKIENPEFNKVIIYRVYRGGTGKEYKEEFIVTNDLSKIKARMKKK